ncbi:MAG: HupE/UreJ family protein [Cellvibrionaceae bacterium]
MQFRLKQHTDAPKKYFLALFCLFFSGFIFAHNISESNAQFVEGVTGPAIAPFLYLGAKHMVTGYDHLLFLIGVIFFLYKLKDVVLYVTLFTIGHSITLLGGVLGEIQVNAYIIDAIIGFSIVYKAFENMGGFKKTFGFNPNTKAAVLIFGLFHGLGLATKLQEFSVSKDGLITNIISFNIGVEIGQFLALAAILILLIRWRQSPNFQKYAFGANAILMTGGFLLAGYHLSGYFLPAS